MNQYAAIYAAVLYSLNKIGLGAIRSDEFFGMNQPVRVDTK